MIWVGRLWPLQVELSLLLINIHLIFNLSAFLPVFLFFFAFPKKRFFSHIIYLIMVTPPSNCPPPLLSWSTLLLSWCQNPKITSFPQAASTYLLLWPQQPPTPVCNFCSSPPKSFLSSSPNHQGSQLAKQFFLFSHQTSGLITWPTLYHFLVPHLVLCRFLCSSYLQAPGYFSTPLLVTVLTPPVFTLC